MKEIIIAYDENTEASPVMGDWVGELVRCKNCKYGVKSPTFQYYPEVTWCNKHSTSHNDNWFCADGEQKTNCSDIPNS